MRKRMIGNSDIEISDIGLGCWAIGGPFWDRGGWMGYGEVDDAAALQSLRRALELGVTFFDTANVYGCGHSERLLGEATRGRRDVVISDKFGFTFDESQRKVLGTDASPAAIRQSCEDSLGRLQRERIDMYTFQLWDHPIEQIDEVLRTLDALVEEGKVRSYAWLTDDVERVRRFAQGKYCFAAPQLLNVLEVNLPLLKLCEERNLEVLTRRPLAMGLLTGKYNAESTFHDNDMRHRFGWNLRDGKQAKMLGQLERVRAILTSEGRTLAQGALCWIWGRSPLAVPVPGFKNQKQVEDNIAAVNFGPLRPEQMQEIEDLLRNPKTEIRNPK